MFAFNPFDATGFFPYPLKTSENQRFSDVFWEYRKRQVARNGLITTVLHKLLYFKHMLWYMIENCYFPQYLKVMPNEFLCFASVDVYLEYYYTEMISQQF